VIATSRMNVQCRIAMMEQPEPDWPGSVAEGVGPCPRDWLWAARGGLGIASEQTTTPQRHGTIIQGRSDANEIRIIRQLHKKASCVKFDDDLVGFLISNGQTHPQKMKNKMEGFFQSWAVECQVQVNETIIRLLSPPCPPSTEPRQVARKPSSDFRRGSTATTLSRAGLALP
jgi:hypothetical protein